MAEHGLILKYRIKLGWGYYLLKILNRLGWKWLLKRLAYSKLPIAIVETEMNSRNIEAKDILPQVINA